MERAVGGVQLEVDHARHQGHAREQKEKLPLSAARRGLGRLLAIEVVGVRDEAEGQQNRSNTTAATGLQQLKLDTNKEIQRNRRDYQDPRNRRIKNGRTQRSATS